MQDEGSESRLVDLGHGPAAGRAVWRERALVLLVVACLGGTLNLVISIHRRALRDREREEAASAPAVAVKLPEPPPPAPAPPPRVAATPKPARPPRPQPPPEDPTKKAVAELEASATAEAEAGRQADRKASSLEAARLAAVAESQRWKRRELLVHQQVDAIAQRAQKIDRQIDTLAAQRDVLARERDTLKAAVAKAQQGEGSYAVLPYKGPNGSWRRPIVLECSNGSVTIRPSGPTFSMMDLSGLINPRSSPVVVALARELLRVRNSDSPDGEPVVPYLVFLVRPDGIRSYYELRSRLEPLGIAFGYELIDQDLKVDVPDYDNVATWDGTIPLDPPQLAADGPGNGTGGGESGDGLAWPGAPSRSGGRGEGPGGTFASRNGRPGAGTGGQGGDGPGDDGDSPDAFVWPSGRGNGAAGGAGGSALPERPSSTALSGRARGSHGALGFGDEGGGAAAPRPMPRRDGGSGGGSGRSRLNLAVESAIGGQGGLVPGIPRGTGGGASPLNGTALEPAPANGPDGGRPRTGRSSGPAGAGTTASALGLPDLEPADAAGQGRGASAGQPGEAGPEGEAGLDAALLGEALRSASGSGSAAGSGSASGSVSGSASGSAGARAGAITAGASLGLGTMSGGGSQDGSRPNTSSGAGLVFGSSDGTAGAKGERQPGAQGAGTPTGSRIPDGPTPAIEVPFEITVVCQPTGLVVHPGGYQLSRAALDRNKKEGILVRELLAVAGQRAAADPSIRPRPRVKFLVESGGSPTFWAARKQVLFSGLGWPMSLQVSGGQESRLLDPETWP